MKRKQRKKWMGSMILMAGIVIMFFTTEEAQAAAKKPELSKKALNLAVDQQKKLSVKHKQGCIISWKSSKKAVATVSKTGKVKAKKNGNAKITALIKPIKGGRSYRLICKISVKKAIGQENSAAKTTDKEKGTDQYSSDSTLGTPMLTEQNVPGQSGSTGEKVEQPGINQGIPGQSGSTEQMPEQSGIDQEMPGQSGSTGQMPEQPGLDPGASEEPGITEQPPLDEPAGSTTGSAVTDGEAKLLFSNYNDGIRNGNFFGNQMIVSYEQLQNLIGELQAEMSGYGNWKQGYEQLQWYCNRLEEIGQDYFSDHVLYIHTMSVSRGYDYTLDSVTSVIKGSGEKELYINLKRHYNLKEDECVTCDMPYYSFFIQMSQELVQGCENIECSLLSDEYVVPSDDLDYLYTI